MRVRVRLRSFSSSHGDSNASSPQRRSMPCQSRSTLRSRSSLVLASSMTACTTVPIPAASPLGEAAIVSTNHARGDFSKVSSRDGETRTTASGSSRSTSGSVVDGSSSPYQDEGSAPSTSASASRASAWAASADPVVTRRRRSRPTMPRNERRMRSVVLVVGREVTRETEERRGLLVVVGGRREQHLAAGARDCEGEHPQLVAQDLGACVFGLGRASLDGVGQLLRVEQRAAQPEVRPDALLQARHRDHLELPADGGTRGAHEHRVAGGPGGEGVFGNLGAEELDHEIGGRTFGIPLDEAPRCGEECDDPSR